ncbi:cation:proton antiporter [Alkalibacter saccharofermentans]|uniref:NhaP-type Na+/H+ or K+/H+ antiporter n=1 Tax=Alkalibacter saccharofermentans DSM 14828 TaxID=1120975 RepID=A0A1M4VLC6_9FIRM|nr:cation:proton antiporter [Alkalibacter saccharofermentans]SHE69728.1 NhaP-type Na+/H+ or K+/H+ antiporter [Alkalibacter saccharofermentans DSM 14828]
MLFSLSLILIIGFALSGIFNRIKIPGLLAMIITGIVLGPYVMDLIAPEILMISSDLRKIALIVILARAGLSLDLEDLKRVGRPAALMCFIPATLEIIAIILLGPRLLGLTLGESAILGAVLAAVSPAVIVPRMLYLMESGYGKKNSIPQLILAGASVDDIYVIVLFAAFLGMHQGEGFNAGSLFSVPVSIISGVVIGITIGALLVRIFKILHVRDTIKVLIILSVSFLFVSFEQFLEPYFPMSGLIAVMALGGTILKLYDILAKRLMGKFSKIWVGAEILLFVLVGAAVDITLIPKAGFFAVLLIFAGLGGRVLGVWVSLFKTPIVAKERIFCSIAYLPKATVQAAIGAVPLSMGVPSGDTILAVAVLSIMVTAPIGAFGIDLLHDKLLEK